MRTNTTTSQAASPSPAFHYSNPRGAEQERSLCEEIELALHTALPESTIFTHLEPKEDPVTFEDIELDRVQLQS